MANDWASAFDEAYPRPGASTDDIASLLADLARPISPAEVSEVMAAQGNPFPADHPLRATYRPFDALKWTLPGRRPLADYLSLLRWSNGGSFRNGSRWFGPLFATDEVRKMLLAYHVPQYMPGALPFALDGRGNFYAFDMRRPPAGGE